MRAFSCWRLKQEMTSFRCHQLILFLVLHCHVTHALLTMLTQGQEYVFSSGSQIQLDCEFIMDDFAMFDNPIVWKKTQLDEAVQMNTMRSIHAPFLQTTRVKVQLTDNSPRYRLLLTIENCSAEDSGNYTCEVRGKKSTVLNHVTHTIAVRAPVQKVFFTSDNLTANSVLPAAAADTTTSALPLRRLAVLDGRRHGLRCVALGGYPPPSIHLYLGEQDITDLFRVTGAVALYGVRGLRLIVHRTEAITDRLRATKDMNGERVKCFATVPGLLSNLTAITIAVNYAPVIHCLPTTASVGQRDVSIRCQIRARPDLLALFWIINANGSTVTQQKGIENFLSHVTVLRDDVTETQLSLRQVLPHHFRRYTVVAENSVDTTTENVELIRSYHHSSRDNKNSGEMVTYVPAEEPQLSRRTIVLPNDQRLDPPPDRDGGRGGGDGHSPSSMTLSPAASVSASALTALGVCCAAAFASIASSASMSGHLVIQRL